MSFYVFHKFSGYVQVTLTILLSFSKSRTELKAAYCVYFETNEYALAIAPKTP